MTAKQPGTIAGQMMRILLTGATGLLGRSFLDIASGQGHDLLCVSRGSQLQSEQSNVSWMQRELQDRSFADVKVGEIDWGVHLAINYDDLSTGGENDKITQNFLDMAERNRVAGVVLASSIAVYDYLKLETGSEVEISAPLIAKDDFRQDDYALLKRRQEQQFTDFSIRTNIPTVIGRIGLLYSSDRMSVDHAGIFLGPVQIISNHHGQVPVSNVQVTAEKILRMMEENNSENITIRNILDDKPKYQREYLHELKRMKKLSKFAISLHWTKVIAIGSFLVSLISRFRMLHHAPNRIRAGSLARRLKPFIFVGNRSELEPIDLSKNAERYR